MNAIEKLVCELNNSSLNECERVAILQKIGGLLLNKYVIQINETVVIEPLLVEAYYFRCPEFMDENTYKEQKQKNRPGKLYVHSNKHSWGLDICLSYDENYYLAFLIKYSLLYINGKCDFCGQQKLTEKIASDVFGVKYSDLANYIEDIDVLSEKKNFDYLYVTNSDILTTKRKGTSKGKFSDKELAILLLDKLRGDINHGLKFNYRLETGYSATDLLKKYIVKNPYGDREKYQLLCKNLINEKKLDDLIREGERKGI